MTLVEVPVQIRVPDLVKAIEQLPPTDLDELLMQVRLLQKRQQSEAALLNLIYHPLPVEQKTRLYELGDKLEMETITEEEREELLKLVDISEAADVERAEALLVLAERRGITVGQLLRATIEALHLNRPALINLRRVLYVVGEHPPVDPD